MLFTIKEWRAGANPESPPRTHSVTNTCEVRTPSRTVFTMEQNELFVQRVVQYCQEKEGDEFLYHALGFNKSSKKDKIKKPIVTWLVNFTLTKISMHRLLMWCPWKTGLSDNSKTHCVIMVQWGEIMCPYSTDLYWNCVLFLILIFLIRFVGNILWWLIWFRYKSKLDQTSDAIQ